MMHPFKEGGMCQCCLPGSCLQATDHQLQLGGTVQSQLPGRKLREQVLA